MLTIPTVLWYGSIFSTGLSARPGALCEMCRGLTNINIKRDVLHSLEYSRLETPKGKSKILLEIVLSKNSITWFLGVWHGSWLAEVDNTAFICFQWNRGEVRVCLGTACGSELHYTLMHHRFSSTMLLHGAFCSLARRMACTNPITDRLHLTLNTNDATGCGGFWGRKALTQGDASSLLTCVMEHNRVLGSLLHQVPGRWEVRKMASGYGVLCNKDSEHLKTGLSGTQRWFYSHEGRQRSY